MTSHKLHMLDYIQAHLEDVSLEAINNRTRYESVSLRLTLQTVYRLPPTNMWIKRRIERVKN